MATSKLLQTCQTFMYPFSSVVQDSGLFKTIVPVEVGNYIFIKLVGSLHQVMHSLCTLKKTGTSFYER
jgi:hypothetical protein